MHADNLAEDIWTRYTGPYHVSNKKRYDGFKGILGLQLYIMFMLNFICYLVCPEFAYYPCFIHI